MRRYELVDVKAQRLTKLICDVCKADMTNDELETQEVFSLNSVGGYSSIFGDGATIEIDICQDCFREKLGEYALIDTSDCF